MAPPAGSRSRQLLQPLPLRIEGDYGEVRALAWWLSGGEIRFSCKDRILPGRPRTIHVRVAGEESIPLEVMVRKASTLPSEGDVATFLHKGSYRLLRGSDEPRLRRVRQQGDPQNPVKAPTMTGSVTPKRRTKAKTLPTGKALREAVARGRGGHSGEGWWAPEGVPAVLEPGERPSLYVDLSVAGHAERCVDRREVPVRLHLGPLPDLTTQEAVGLVVRLPDHTFHQLEALVERHHSRGTVLQVAAAEALVGLPQHRKNDSGT